MVLHAGALGFNIRIEKQNQELKYSELDRLDEYISKITFFNEKYPQNKEINVAETYETTLLTTLTTNTHDPMDSPWPMKCHDNRHTSQSPYSTADNPYTEKWNFECDRIPGGVVLDNNGTIYFGDFDDYLYALNPDGTLKWKYRTGGWIWSTPAIDEKGIVYIGSYDGRLYSINPNGTLNWRFQSGGSISSSPAIAEDGTIYFGTMGPDSYGRIYALFTNGTEKWHYDTDYLVVSDPAIADDGTVYIGSGDTYFYALNPNGTLKWRFKTGNIIKAHPSIAEDGTIYIASFDHNLYALNPDGTLKWKRGSGSSGSSSVAIGNDGILYFGGNPFYAANSNNGTTIWSLDLGPDRHIDKSSPAISADGVIYFGTNVGETTGGEIIAVNPDGTERWRKWIADEWVDSSPCIGEDGTIYIGSDYDMGQGRLYAFGRNEFEANANGPYKGIYNNPLKFNGSAEGGYPPYSWEWDFGDGNYLYEQNPTHTYAQPGNYTVTLYVTDSTDGPNSTVNDTTWANIRAENNPPNAPIIDGPTQGKAGETYDYTFVATDPEEDEIVYVIDWGDELGTSTGPYPSGEIATAPHSWQEKDTYTIRTKAIDAFGAESEWGTLEVTMPVNQQSTYPLFQQFFDRFPHAFPILRHLLRY